MKKVLLFVILSIVLMVFLLRFQARVQEEKKIADRMRQLKRWPIDDEVPLSDWRKPR